MRHPKSKWSAPDSGWSIPFKLDKQSYRKLEALTSTQTAEALQAAACLFVNRRNLEELSPCTSELRQAFIELQKWVAEGKRIIPKEDPILEDYGWDYRRIKAFKEEMNDFGAKIDQILSGMKPHRGPRTKTQQQLFALSVAKILSKAGLNVTSTREGVFSKSLHLLLAATKEAKDAHRLVEQTVKAL